jgi:regulator of replication initiation timing
MNADEQKIKDAFKLAKTDIARLQRQVDLLEQKFDKVLDVLDTLKSHQLKVSQKVNTMSKKKPSKTKKTKKKTTKKTSKRKSKKYVASKSGKKFHIEECPFAKNIKPKYKVRFKSKTKALNQGYKPCNCVNK